MGIKANVEPLASLAAASIGATFTAINPSGFDHAVSAFLLQNLTDAAVEFSIDLTIGSQIILPAMSGLVFDITTNRPSTDAGLYFIRGTIVYAKQSGVPTTGSVYVTGLYDTSN